MYIYLRQEHGSKEGGSVSVKGLLSQPPKAQRVDGDVRDHGGDIEAGVPQSPFFLPGTTALSAPPPFPQLRGEGLPLSLGTAEAAGPGEKQVSTGQKPWRRTI